MGVVEGSGLVAGPGQKMVECFKNKCLDEPSSQPNRLKCEPGPVQFKFCMAAASCHAKRVSNLPFFVFNFRWRTSEQPFWSWQQLISFALRVLLDQSRTCQKQTKEVSDCFSTRHHICSLYTVLYVPWAQIWPELTHIRIPGMVSKPVLFMTE